jgi:hypothetical protein
LRLDGRGFGLLFADAFGRAFGLDFGLTAARFFGEGRRDLGFAFPAGADFFLFLFLGAGFDLGFLLAAATARRTDGRPGLAAPSVAVASVSPVAGAGRRSGGSVWICRSRSSRLRLRASCSHSRSFCSSV